MQEVFEKIIDKLEGLRGRYGDEYFGIKGILLKTIEIVKKEAEEYNNGWIPFTQRKLTEEEKEEIGTEYDYMLDCKLPEEDEEILVTYANGTVGEDIFMCDGSDCYLDSGNDFITEAIAWQPLPEPYKPKGE